MACPAEQARPSGRGGSQEQGVIEKDGVEVVVDPTQHMSARQRKLHELKEKLGQCRKANQGAVVQEKKRLRVGLLFVTCIQA